MASAPSASSNSPCITHLPSCPSPPSPTNSSDESILGGGGLWWIRAQAPTNPAILPPTLIPNLITVNTPTEVTATVSIPDPTLNPTTVELLRVNANATTVVVAQMGDTGKAGDQKPGDKVFTAKVNLNETQVRVFGFQVAATFRGKDRTRSPVQQFVVLAPHTVPAVLPPDPGEVGKATLAGIDSDRDGVRDDIQRYIIFTYPQSSKTRESLTQYAKATQSFLLQSNSEQGAIAAARVLNDAQDCTFYVLGVSMQSISIRRDLRAEFLNTPARARAYITADGYLGGISAPGTPDEQKRARCSFNPDTMEN